MPLRQVNLPHGRLGVYFSGSPPRIDGIHHESPLRGIVSPGEYAHSILYPGVLEIWEFHDTKTFVKLLSQYDAQQRRVLVLSDEAPTLTGSVKFKLYLPPGKVGIALKEIQPPTVSQVDPESPIANIVRVGMIVDRASIPGTPVLEGETTSYIDLAEALSRNSTSSGRVLWLSEKAEMPAEPTSPVPTRYDVASPQAQRSLSPIQIPREDGPTVGPAMSDPTELLKFSLEGVDNQSIRLHLECGQSILADPKSLIFMSDGVEITVAANSNGRWSSGESSSLASFTCADASPGTVCLAPPHGRGMILPIQLEQFGGVLTCQRESFLCSDHNVGVGIEFSTSLAGAAFDGGFILHAVTGTGLVFLTTRGSVLQKRLEVGECIKVTAGALVAFENGVRHELQTVPFGGGPDAVMSALTGPGTVWMQTAPLLIM